jgi:hypothetical protein
LFISIATLSYFVVYFSACVIFLQKIANYYFSALSPITCTSLNFQTPKMSRNTPKQAVPEFRTMNADLFTLTYGALVMDVIRDREQPEEVNRQLDKIGYNMGLRMADDFLAKNPRIGRCSTMQQLGEVLAKSACKTYLGVQVSWVGF